MEKFIAKLSSVNVARVGRARLVINSRSKADKEKLRALSGLIGQDVGVQLYPIDASQW